MAKKFSGIGKLAKKIGALGGTGEIKMESPTLIPPGYGANTSETRWKSGVTEKSYDTKADAYFAEIAFKQSDVGQLSSQILNQPYLAQWTMSDDLAGKSPASFANEWAEKLVEQNVTNLNQLSSNNGALVNRATGKAVTGLSNVGRSTSINFAYDQSGNPVLYTQYIPEPGKKSFFDKIAPFAGLALMFVPGLQGVGAALGSALGASGAVAAGLGNAIIQGALTEAQGGDFLKGAALSGVGSIAGGVIQPGLSEALGGGAAGNIASNALIGGGMSELSGGDFVQGALISGIGSGINEAKLAAASDYLDSLPGGHGLYTDDLPDMSDFAELDPASFQIGDTNFAPDYSLGRGTSGAPGLSVAPINTQIQVGSFDYSVGDLLDGLGLKMPDTPSLGSMGGGQGIILKTNGGYITDSGFVPDSYVASLGDPDSFINKPVIDVQLSLGELQGASELDISNKLAGLDVAKFLTPYALAALTKKVYDQSRGDSASGFAMVPIPGDWKSPEYDQTFTPSAPINFGSAGMLAGTQFANQPAAATPSFYNLSDVINTLNFDSVPFVQQQLQMPQQSFDVPDILQQFQTPNNIGMNDTIGNLDGSPATLNSIIAGIQSQYG